MIKNASAGEYVFFNDLEFLDPQKAHAFICKRGREVLPYEHVIYEEDLNSFARSKEKVWTESDLVQHEINYMRANSQGRSFYIK